MNYRVVLSDQTKEDIKEISDFIGFLSLQASARQVRRLTDRMYSLDFMPERYKIYDAFPIHENIRIVSVDNYCIIYHVDNETETVTILRVVNGKCDMDTLDIDIHLGEKPE